MTEGERTATEHGSERPGGVLHAADLSPVARTYLGVLDTGIVASRLANDPTLRLDSITAVCLALRQDEPRDTYLEGEGPEPSEAFLDELDSAIRDLDARGIIAAAPLPFDYVAAPDTPRPLPQGRFDFDQRPKIFNRALAHECMEELFRDMRVYSFLMGKYQDSSDVYARLYQENPQRFL